jgi:hypothetical protein
MSLLSYDRFLYKKIMYPWCARGFFPKVSAAHSCQRHNKKEANPVWVSVHFSASLNTCVSVQVGCLSSWSASENGLPTAKESGFKLQSQISESLSKELKRSSAGTLTTEGLGSLHLQRKNCNKQCNWISSSLIERGTCDCKVYKSWATEEEARGLDIREPAAFCTVKATKRFEFYETLQHFTY